MRLYLRNNCAENGINLTPVLKKTYLAFMHRVLPTLQFVREEVHLSRELSLFLQFMREQKKKIILEKNDKGSVA